MNRLLPPADPLMTRLGKTAIWQLNNPQNAAFEDHFRLKCDNFCQELGTQGICQKYNVLILHDLFLSVGFGKPLASR